MGIGEQNVRETIVCENGFGVLVRGAATTAIAINQRQVDSRARGRSGMILGNHYSRRYGNGDLQHAWLDATSRVFRITAKWFSKLR